MQTLLKLLLKIVQLPSRKVVPNVFYLLAWFHSGRKCASSPWVFELRLWGRVRLLSDKIRLWKLMVSPCTSLLQGTRWVRTAQEGFPPKYSMNPWFKDCALRDPQPAVPPMGTKDSFVVVWLLWFGFWFFTLNMYFIYYNHQIVMQNQINTCWGKGLATVNSLP